MAAESPLLGQLRHIPSSPVISTGPSVEPRPPLSAGADPLQGLVQEMALSAVMQKHGSSTSSTASSSFSNSNGPIIKNYIVPAQAGSTDQLTEVAAAQRPGVVLGGAGGSGFIALPGGAQTGGLLAQPSHTHTSPVIQGTTLTAVPQLAGQLHEVTSASATNMVQLTPIYEGPGSALPSPAVERSALLQPSM